MDHRDRQAIEELFQRLRAVEQRSGPRDPEAEALIGSAIAAQPGAPYYLAQTVVVQRQALESAQQRIEELEASSSGGFLSGLFGNSGNARRPVANARARAEERGQPSDHSRGGGFLAGAAQTAMGVAGGVLLGNMIAGALFGGPGQAEQADSQADNADNNDAGNDSGGEFDTADSGGGDFDVGGDF